MSASSGAGDGTVGPGDPTERVATGRGVDLGEGRLELVHPEFDVLDRRVFVADVGPDRRGGGLATDRLNVGADVLVGPFGQFVEVQSSASGLSRV